MYIYFDKNGTIKEVINDESIRRGSNDYNKIYCYLEGNPVIDDIWYLQKNPDGTLTNEVSFIDNIVTKSIPYDSKRDMKYFQDFEEYKFYVFTLSSSYLSQNGLVVATIRVAENNTLWALGELTFNVQANIVNSDNDITQSQYDYLLLTISSYYSKSEIDRKLDLKADKSDTYTKQEVNELTGGLSGEIDTVRKSVNGLNTRTSYLENTVDDLRAAQQLADVVLTYADLQEYYVRPLDSEDKVQVMYDDTHDGDSTVYKWDGSNWIYLGSYSSNTYNKTEVDNLLNDKADKSNTYTKTEVDGALLKKADKSDVYTKTEVDGKFDGVGNEFATLSNDVLNLQSSVSDLKSVQNVVDVVPTYEALQKYDASKVETYDKIQVIADETHDGASTIYNRLGSFWYYVGAFGTNSYTKTEVDTKLSTKADKTDTYTKQEVDDKLNGYIKDNDTTYSATFRGKEVVVGAGEGYGSTTYKLNSIHTSAPRKPSCDYSFPAEKSGTLALTSDIPTVNNPTITFTQGGVTKGSFSLNQSSDQTIDLDAGGSGGGSSVVANPTLSGNEATLNGLEVDGTKYKVGGGSEVHLYEHHINICGMNQNWDDMQLYVCFDIYLPYNTPLTYIEVKDWLYNNGFSNKNNILSVISNESTNEVAGVDKHMIIGIYANESFIYNIMQYTNGEKVGKVAETFFQLSKSCIDTVTQIF